MLLNDRCKRRYILWCIFLVIITGSLVRAEDNSPENTAKIYSAHPHCGLYCLYSVLKMESKELDFRDLVKPEYLGSRKGSSLAELKQAAEDFGMNAAALGQLTSEDLKSIELPIILHVKSSDAQKEYDHFVLFLGDKDSKARIFDPPNPIETVPYYELATRWDGTGLIVSAEPIELSKILLPARKRFALFVGVIIAAIVLVKTVGKLLSRKIKTISRPAMLTFSAAQSAGLVMVALWVGVIYHFAHDEGFLAHAGATEPVVRASFGHFIPKVSAKDIQNAAGNTIFVDARRDADYQAGHIDGAINIPTTLCAAGRTAKLANTPKDSRVIIYCQSAGCPYAEIVATHLKEDGFYNFVIYKGGWVDWQKRQESRGHDETKN